MELNIQLEGGKKVSTTIGNHRIMTDQSVKDGGEDSAPAPYDLFMASIGTCAGFYVQAYCPNKGIDPAGIKITLRTKRDTENKKIVGFITTIRLPKAVPAKLYPALRKVAEQCAVKKTIMSHPEFIVETVGADD